MSHKISVDKNKCIGCGACAAICSNFKIINGKSLPKKPIVEKLTCEEDARDGCPVNAIKIE
ncbi:MAG: ferredoxin [Candidatus Pacearchaeota archaeon]